MIPIVNSIFNSLLLYFRLNFYIYYLLDNLLLLLCIIIIIIFIIYFYLFMNVTEEYFYMNNDFIVSGGYRISSCFQLFITIMDKLRLEIRAMDEVHFSLD